MISVIIPALNEAANLSGLLDQLSRDGLGHEAPDHEVIVVDGGSVDSTLAIARRLADHVVVAEHGYHSFKEAGGLIPEAPPR